MEKLIEKLYKTHSLSAEEIFRLLSGLDNRTKTLLYDYADRTRQESYGKKVYLRGLLEFSNVCRQNCFYCGLRMDNPNVSRYRLSPEEILQFCETGHRLGYQTFVLQSGEDDWYTDEDLVYIISELKRRYPKIAVTLSVGEKSRASYEAYYNAGADRYLLRHETADRNLYQKLHPGMSMEKRMQCLEDLKDIGYQIGAGFIVGLPGQTREILVKDFMYLKQLQPHMVGIGPLIVHPDTPLKNCVHGTEDLTRVCLAITRLLLPEVLLPSTTSLNVLSPDGMKNALQTGSNVVMPNMAPIEIRSKYELYKGRIINSAEGRALLEEIKESITRAGYEADMSRGDHRDWTSKNAVNE